MIFNNFLRRSDASKMAELARAKQHREDLKEVMALIKKRAKAGYTHCNFVLFGKTSEKLRELGYSVAGDLITW